MDPGALYAQQDSQVDGGPAGGALPTVTAQFIAREALHPLEQALPASPGPSVSSLTPISELAGRVNAAGGGRGRPVQTLRGQAASSETARACDCGHVRVRVSPHLDVIVVGDVFVSRGDARLDRLYPRLSQLLRLSLQHAAPAETPTMPVCVDVHLQATREADCMSVEFREGIQGQHILCGGNHLETEPPLVIFTGFDRTQSQILHHHGQGILQRYS